MSYHILWFRRTAHQLQMLEPDFEFSLLTAILRDRLPYLVQEMAIRGLDLEDPNAWWSAVFMDAVLRIENAQGKNFRVAVGLFEEWEAALNALKTTQSRQFRAIRADLGIDQHWLIYIEGKRPYPNEHWMDLLYREIDRKPGYRGCSLLEMTAH